MCRLQSIRSTRYSLDFSLAKRVSVALIHGWIQGLKSIIHGFLEVSRVAEVRVQDLEFEV